MKKIKIFAADPKCARGPVRHTKELEADVNDNVEENFPQLPVQDLERHLTESIKGELADAKRNSQTQN